jgi:hypothetical protein
MMAMVLTREERLGEVLDVGALLALATSDTNLHLIATLVNTKHWQVTSPLDVVEMTLMVYVRPCPGWYGVAFLDISAATLSFAIVVGLILRYHELFLTNRKTKEACARCKCKASFGLSRCYIADQVTIRDDCCKCANATTILRY